MPLAGAVGRAGGARRTPARAGRPDHRPALGRAHRRRLRPGAPSHLRAACPAGASPTRSVPSMWPDGSAPARLASMVRGAAEVRAHRSMVEPEDFESWAVERYGRPAFATLLDGYTDKLFGLPAREVDVGFAQSLVGAPSGRAGAGGGVPAPRRRRGAPRRGRRRGRASRRLPALRHRGGAARRHRRAGRRGRTTRRRRRALRPRRVDAPAAAAPRAVARCPRGARAAAGRAAQPRRGDRLPAGPRRAPVPGAVGVRVRPAVPGRDG